MKMNDKNKLRKAKSLLNLAEKELNKYKDNLKFAHLSQACEKTWVAFILILEYQTGKEINKGSEIEHASNQLNLIPTYRLVKYLHVIHYEGSPGIDDETTINEVQTGINEVENLIH